MGYPTGTLFTIVLTFICATMCTLILFHTIYKLTFPNERPHKLSEPERIRRKNGTVLILITLFASTFCVYCDFMRYSICAVNDYDEKSYPLNQIMSIADFLLFIGDGAFYSLAVYRFYISFQDTLYAIRRSIILLLAAMICMQCITAMYYCVSVALQPASPNSANAYFEHRIAPSIALLILNDLILNISLLLLFVSKLRATLTNTLVSNSIKQIGSSIDTISGSVVDVICRHSLLFGFAIISNQLFFSSNIAFYYLFQNIGMPHFIVFCCRALENLSKSMVLFLGLRHNREMYRKICANCHKGLASCFVKTTQRIVDEEILSRRSDLQYRRLSGTESDAKLTSKSGEELSVS